VEIHACCEARLAEKKCPCPVLLKSRKQFCSCSRPNHRWITPSHGAGGHHISRAPTTAVAGGMQGEVVILLLLWPPVNGCLAYLEANLVRCNQRKVIFIHVDDGDFFCRLASRIAEENQKGGSFL
jgi:hypothetical protein